MKELREFIKDITGVYGDDVTFAIGVVEEDKREFVEVKELLDRINKLSVKEITDEYFESVEFITNNDEYMEISVL